MVTRRTGGAAAALWLAAAVAACGGASGQADPGGGDPGRPDPAWEAAADEGQGGDDGTSRDLPAADAPPEDPGPPPPDEGPADPGTPPADDGPGDPGTPPPDEGPADPGTPPPDPGPADPGTADPGVPPDGWLLAPAATCPAPADACAPAAPDPAAPLEATYRKDFFLLDGEYNEYTDYPTLGGRFHVAAVSAVTGTIQEILLDGTPVEDLLVKPRMEWYHAWPRKVRAGEPVWFAFHSKDGAWDKATEARLVMRTADGVAVDGTFAVRKARVPLTYVTTTSDRSAFVIHARNDDAKPQVLTSLEVNGREVLQSGVACVPRAPLAPGATATWTVPWCGPVEPGSAWTVVARFADAPPSVGVGRVLKPFFPIETWPNTSDCPFPTGDADNWRKHYLAGFDTYHTYWGGYDDSDCAGLDPTALANDAFPALGDQFLMMDANFGGKPLSTTDAVVGFLTGDESDGEVWDDAGKPVPATKAAKARSLWDRYPEVAVYNGAKTNGNVGAFAGMTDIQGMDFYNAACAPHITAWGNHPPIDGPYDYLRNTRNNHMPLPTWLYAQGIAPMWNFQPDATEVTVAAYSVLAAGGKGLMWFQTNMPRAEDEPATWDAIAKANFTFRAVRELLREGDVTGAARADKTAIVEAVRARDALVLVVIDTDVESAPTDLGCAGSGIGLKPHWKLRNIQPNLSVDVPEDLGVREVFEVRGGAVIPVSYPLSLSGRTLRFGPVPLSNADPARVFVVAGAEGVREAVAAAGARTSLP